MISIRTVDHPVTEPMYNKYMDILNVIRLHPTVSLCLILQAAAFHVKMIELQTSYCECC